MTDNTQQQQQEGSEPASLTWLRELHNKLVADLPEKFKDVTLDEQAQRKLFETATPEENEKIARLQTLVGVFVALQQGLMSVAELDKIKTNFEAAETAKKDPYKSIESDLQATLAAYAAAQRKPSTASGITQDGVPLSDFDGEDPGLDGEGSEQSGLSKFMRKLRKKPLNEVLHGHWPGYNPNGLAISQLGEFIDTSRYNDKVAKTGNLHFKVKGGGTICWRMDRGGEFIGRTNLQSRFGKKPLKEADANAIMSIAKVRGWKSINLHGTAKEKNELWLAAMKQGIHVPETNFIPSDEYKAKWEAYQRSSGFENKGYTGVSEAAQTQTTAPSPAAPPADPTAEAETTRKGPATKTRFSQPADDGQTAAEKPADDAAAKAPKTGRGGQGRQP